MKKYLALGAVALLALTAAPRPADALVVPKYKFFKFYKFKYHKKPTVKVHGGSGSSAFAQYIGGSIACSASFLILRAIYVSNTYNRQLTQQEANETVAGCFIPFVGAFLVSQHTP